MTPTLHIADQVNLAEPLWIDARVACPCCDDTERVAYSIKMDEYTCYQCGLVASVVEFRAHWYDLQDLPV
jgi:hypothetical protein